LWDPTSGLQVLNDSITTGWTIDGVFGINNANQILATASFDSGPVDYVLLTPQAVVPEPHTFVLSSLGLLAGLAVVQLRQRR
jgi:hypothetical protein